MKYCKIGAHVKNNQKFVHSVATHFKIKIIHQSEIKKYLVIGIILTIIILLIILYKIVAASLSPESEAKTISEDLKKGDTKTYQII